MNLKNVTVEKELLQDVVNNIEYNKTIISYYERFANDGSIAFSKDLLLSKGERLDYCNKFWHLDKYEKQKIKDFQKTNLCHDKFCANCKKVVQAGRMAKYIPELEKYKSNLYHLILTVPNCSGQDLNFMYKKMAKSFRTLIRYLDCRLKVKGINFERFKYQGAVRSLEVTFKGDSYHPHFHVGIVLDFELGRKKDINTYSYNNKNGVRELKRLFSKEEILIQKIWYLLINNIKVTKRSIEDLEEGYSCAIEKFNEDDYAELFKYISKGSDEEGNTLTYDNFISLYYGLYRVKQIQGYGCLYRIDDNIDLEELEKQYDEYIQEIRKKESPVVAYETPQDLILDSEYTLISRKTFFKYLRQL
jgi:Plasmid rolling circle replication initiator protein and truncated derivatives